MNKKKVWVSLLFFIILIAVTYFIVFSKNDITEITNVISSINIKYIVAGLILGILYFFMQGLYMKILLKTLNTKTSIQKGIFYSIVEFFFSGITPSSTGGQPFQLYYMTEDGIPAEKSMIVLILNSIMFKLYLVAFGILILLFASGLVFGAGVLTSILFIFGLIVDIAVIIFCHLLIFNESLVEHVIRWFYKGLSKFRKLMKHTQKNIDYEEKIQNLLKKYKNNADYIRNHKKDVFIGGLITFIQRTLLFSITYVVYKGFGLSGISYIKLLILQTFTQITIEGLPFPGGTGALEAIISNTYEPVFGEMTTASMLLVRCLSFYIPLIISILIIAFKTKTNYKKN